MFEIETSIEHQKSILADLVAPIVKSQNLLLLLRSAYSKNILWDLTARNKTYISDLVT